MIYLIEYTAGGVVTIFVSLLIEGEDANKVKNETLLSCALLWPVFWIFVALVIAGDWVVEHLRAAAKWFRL